MAFQFYALYPSLTVAENLANPLHAENLSDDEVKRKILRVRSGYSHKPHGGYAESWERFTPACSAFSAHSDRQLSRP